MKHGRSLTVLLGGLAVAATLGLLATQAQATPASGTTGPILATGSVDERIKIKTRRDVNSEVTFQKVTIAPGGTTGWHSHGAEVIAVVNRGTLTLTEENCSVRTLPAGTGFTENPGDVHEGRNLGSVPVEVFVTYVALPASDLRIDAEDPC